MISSMFYRLDSNEDSLAQYDAILQTQLKVFSNRHASNILDPVPQLLLLLQVILLSNLQIQNNIILKSKCVVFRC